MPIPLLAALLALSACASACTSEVPALPHVRVVGAAPSSDPRVFVQSGDEVGPAVVRGMRAWEAIGFDVSMEDFGLDECRPAWVVADGIDCQFTIGVVAEPGTVTRSFRDLRVVYLDESMDDDRLLTAAAHEAGHILLDTATHTRNGVMAGRWPRLSDDDLALACESIGACL